MTEENKKVFVVYNKQRWDMVQLKIGYTNKEEAEKHRERLERLETVYDEVYCVEEIEVKSDKNKNIPLKCSKCLKLKHSDCPLTFIIGYLYNNVEFGICSAFSPKIKEFEGVNS